MSKSNDRRSQILSFIKARVEGDGRPPTLDEIAAASGLASRSAAQKHVRALEASGELEVTPKTARSARPRQRKPVVSSAKQWFEISARDIADLSDTDLRTLVARLCIARLANAAMPPSPVTWGGDQNAPDGGIDVRVQFRSGTEAHHAGFSRSVVGIQVKATKMGISEIQKEMCPDGLLRPSIRELIQFQGMYIIATADSSADAEYKKRVLAMRAAAALEPKYGDAEFDYYDAQRLADWTNQHPGVVAWVRSRLGRPFQGWRPYGEWAALSRGKVRPFLPDAKERVSDPHNPGQALSLLDGLQSVRRVLRAGRNVARLIGLSGVGKTRFAQALFEESAAPNALPAELALYTDTADSPIPSPLALLDELLAARRKAILIVDNCGSQLHNQLSERCRLSDCIGLLTIEYDIREDLPAETNVFRIESGSAELIERVIHQDFPEISYVNLRAIADFADGNSRVAIALANTMDSNDSLANLTDKNLFERLFWQGKDVQEQLEVAAQVCALVYSFDGEDIDGELSVLASMAGMSALSLYRQVNELQKRGLAQQRGGWRAILPHAIANTLARNALEAIPFEFIRKNLVLPEGRLLRSFSRRLGYLHTSSSAKNIVRGWLSEGALLGDIANLSPLLLEVLINIAPVDPAETLQCLKRAAKNTEFANLTSLDNPSRSSLIQLLRSLAYDAELFEDCIEILSLFALMEGENTTGSARDLIASLFALYLSGTHASMEQRSTWIKNALKSGNAKLEYIGFKALCSALESYHFSSYHDFEFGGRLRDFGFHPTGDAVSAWFKNFVDIAASLAERTTPLAESARDFLAENFRSLWSNAGVEDALEVAIEPLLDIGWEKGWLAIRQAIYFDGKDMGEHSLMRLRALEVRAQPRTLVSRVKAIVLNSYSAGVDFSDGEDVEYGYEKAEQLARELGQSVATDSDAFDIVLPLIVKNERGRQSAFCAGLADKVSSLEKCWNSLTEAFEATNKEQRNIQGLRGFLSVVYKRDRGVFERILDEAMENPSLAQLVPILQLSAPLDDRGCARLLASMDNSLVPASAFQYLSLGRNTHGLRDEQLANLLQRLSIKPDGVGIALDILYMYIYDNSDPIGPHVSNIARTLIASTPLTGHVQRLDHQLAGLIRKFLIGSNGEITARQILTRIRDGFEKINLSTHDLSETLAELFLLQPSIALDLLVGDEPDTGRAYRLRRKLAGGRRSSALSKISSDALIQWCSNGPNDRWVNVAPLIPAFDAAKSSEQPVWSDNILALIKNAPEPVTVAEALVQIIEPTIWSGSRADIIRNRLPLLDQLTDILGPKYLETVATWRSRLMLTIEREVRRDREEYRSRNERFE